MNELALFAGVGGGILASKLLGWRTVCAVERDAYAATILAQRQNDGLLETFPIWSDATTFDGRPWRGIIDVISGGFPCQDISVAGKGEGIDGKRSGLWKDFARIIGEVRPQFAFVENSPALVNRGLDRVLCDLAALGYDAEWTCLSASDCGAPHIRERVWILAYANNAGQQSGARYWGGSESPESRDDVGRCSEDVAHANGAFSERDKCAERGPAKPTVTIKFGRWPSEPELGRVAHGVANRVDRLKAIGNGQVPRVAASAFCRLLERAQSQLNQ